MAHSSAAAAQWEVSMRSSTHVLPLQIQYTHFPALLYSDKHQMCPGWQKPYPNFHGQGYQSVVKLLLVQPNLKQSNTGLPLIIFIIKYLVYKISKTILITRIQSDMLKLVVYSNILPNPKTLHVLPWMTIKKNKKKTTKTLHLSSLVICQERFLSWKRVELINQKIRITWNIGC